MSLKASVYDVKRAAIAALRLRGRRGWRATPDCIVLKLPGSSEPLPSFKTLFLCPGVVPGETLLVAEVVGDPESDPSGCCEPSPRSMESLAVCAIVFGLFGGVSPFTAFSGFCALLLGILQCMCCACKRGGGNGECSSNPRALAIVLAISAAAEFLVAAVLGSKAGGGMFYNPDFAAQFFSWGGLFVSLLHFVSPREEEERKRERVCSPRMLISTHLPPSPPPLFSPL